ncbi:major facilitator superfamily protein mfs3 [Gelatoporia subvermispora B]|uniref:Major facilitator superfamily protein mfs3 n=1 Tax=Ceriporiopsis subvermispora (strain B) TaxID=914234 RepID=M2PU48_CERS8|nr:major facilitator superfamily protein mfs3 [Gelatoporia subvermispora B]
MSDTFLEDKVQDKETDVVNVEAAIDNTSPGDIYDDDESGVDPVYQAKAKILNAAFHEIGMGRYQDLSRSSDYARIGAHQFMYAVALIHHDGFRVDVVNNLWPVVTSLVFDPAVNEFHFQGPFLTLSQSVGLLLGAVFWGLGSDVWGRRLSFNFTLLITGVFALSAGSAPNKVVLCALIGAWSVGVGGNLPVDSAIFLEFIPASSQYLLTVLSVWWAFGQLLASLVAWPLLARFSCAAGSACPQSSNKGWRYLLFTMGGLMMILFVLRFFVFHLYESPKYLMGRGRDAQAVEVVHQVARYNGQTSTLTLDQLRAVEGIGGASGHERPIRHMDTSAKAAVKRKLRLLSSSHIEPLFATRKLAYSTSLLIIVWALIGLAFPLYTAFISFYLATRGADFGDGSVYITYRNQVILSVIGVPGALLAGWMVELPHLGRRGTLSISTGVFLFASTTARSSNALLGWNCGYTFTSNVMYGVLYALSPELFPTKDRGTGNALVATANRIFGVMAPIIAIYANLTTSVPIFIAGALFTVAGLIALLLPYEPRGKASI